MSMLACVCTCRSEAFTQIYHLWLKSISFPLRRKLSSTSLMLTNYGSNRSSHNITFQTSHSEALGVMHWFLPGKQTRCRLPLLEWRLHPPKKCCWHRHSQPRPSSRFGNISPVFPSSMDMPRDCCLCIVMVPLRSYAFESMDRYNYWWQW